MGLKIAVAYIDVEVSPHFGKCSGYHVFYVEDGKIVRSEVLESPEHRPNVLPKYLSEQNIDCIIAGGMGQEPKICSKIMESKL